MNSECDNLKNQQKITEHQKTTPQNIDEKMNSESTKTYLDKLAHSNKQKYNYGDEDQNEIMSIIDELRLD